MDGGGAAVQKTEDLETEDGRQKTEDLETEDGRQKTEDLETEDKEVGVGWEWGLTWGGVGF
jgi:hypothetical protein